MSPEPTPRAPLVAILNPTSGRGRGGNGRAKLEAALATQFAPGSWRIETTQSAGDAHSLAREAVQAGASAVVACGGDGTLSQVLNGLLEGDGAARGVSLGLIPLGTGNDFARHIGIAGGIESAVAQLAHGETQGIDVARIRLNGSAPVHFLNIAGTGFDALAAQRVDAGRSHPVLRHVRGTPAYLLAVIGELRRLNATALRLEIDGTVHHERGLMCAFANSSSYGGGMRVAPDASLHDGVLDVCLIQDAGRMEFLRAFPGVFAGRHTNHPKVRMYRGSQIRLESDRPLPVLVDGDVLGTTPLEIEVIPGAVEMILPARG